MTTTSATEVPQLATIHGAIKAAAAAIQELVLARVIGYGRSSASTHSPCCIRDLSRAPSKTATQQDSSRISAKGTAVTVNA